MAINNVTVSDRALKEVGAKGASTLQYPADVSETRYIASFQVVKQYETARGALPSKSEANAKYVSLNSDTVNHILLYQTPVNTSYTQNWAKQEGIYSEHGSFDNLAGLTSAGLITDFGVNTAKVAVGGAVKTAWQGNLAASTGVAINPFLGVAYESPDLRTFSVPYVFEPRSAAEAEAVIDIIKAFKYHSAPAYADVTEGLTVKDGDGVIKQKSVEFLKDSTMLQKGLLKAPDIFNINFIDQENGRNSSLFRFGPAVCTEVNCNYATNGIWRAFENGLPVSVELTLVFQEMEIITRDKIAGGY